MSEDRITKVILSNMCMLYKDDEYLIINRTKADWPGGEGKAIILRKPYRISHMVRTSECLT